MPDDLDALDPHGKDPLYAQIASRIRDAIGSGEIGGSTPVPSMKVLTQRYQVSPRTIERALAVLRDEGLIETRIGRGIYAKPGDERPR